MKTSPLTLRKTRVRKQRGGRTAHRSSALAGSIAALLLCVAQSASAANGAWNGSAGDSLWGTAGNWTGGTPGTGDTATFSGPAGAGSAILSLGGGVTVNVISFTSASAAAFTIGSGGVNAQTLTLNNGGAITMDGSVLQNELFNSAIVLGTDATASTSTFTNNSTTNLLTFAGSITGGTGGAAAAKTLAVNGAGNTLISGAIGNGGATSVALTKSGAGNLTLRGIHTYTGLTSIQGGTLTLDNNTGTGSIAGAALTFSGGGTFDYLASAAGSTQAFGGALTFSAGAGNVRSTWGGGAPGGITFATLAARTAGATGNFVISGGTNGTDNSISFGTIGAGFQNQGLFFNGSGYAFANAANSFVRGINYGTDANTATAGAGATVGALTGNHVQVAGSITGQTSLTINTLNLSGADRNFVLGAPAAQTLTLTNGGILKSGGGAALISGGTVAAGAAELVIRADLASDTIKIDSVISGSGGLTVTGAGKVILTGTNTFTGNVNIDGGTLAMNFPLSTDVAGPLGAAGARTISLFGGGTLQIFGSTYNTVALTKAFVIGAGGGTFNVTSGQLQFDDASQFSGTGDLTVNSAGNGILFVGAAAVGYIGFTGNVTINGGTLKAFNVSSLGNTANRSITVNSGSSLDVEVAAFNPGAGTTITLNGNGLNNTGALQNLAALVTTIAGNITLASNASIGSAGTGGLGLSGVISGGFSLTKVGTGAGAVTLSGLNTYTGSTIVNAGTLIADSAINSSPINSASGLIFSGSGTFRYSGSGGITRSMTLNGLTLAGGAGILDVNNVGTGTTLTLGGITRATGGGSVDFRATTGTLGTTALANFAGQTLVNGIVGGFATVNSGANLATLDGSRNVVAYGAYSDINTNGSVVPNGAANNVRIATTAGAGNITIGAGTTDANTLFQNTITPVIVDTAAGILRLGAQGGIVTSSLTSTTGTVTIGTAANSGTLTAGGAISTAGEIIVNTALATPVTINATIADNGTGAVSLTRTGLVATTLTLNGTNTYSGSTSVNSGTLVIGAAGLANINVASAIGKGSAVGSASDLVLNGGILQYALNTAPQSTDRLFSVGLGNGTIDSSSATAANSLSFTGTGAIGFNGQSGSRTFTLTGTNTGGNLLAAVIGDGGARTHFTKSGAGTWILTGNNTYSGTTTVSAGVLMVGNGGTTGSLGTGYIAGTGGTITFNHSDDVTLNNLIIGGTIRQGNTSTLSLNNAANSVTTLAFVGADGGVIDLLADVATNNAGAVGILATNSGTINATGGGRLIINSTAGATNGQDWGAAAGKTLTINAVIANGIANSIDIFQAAGSTGVTILTADNTFNGQINIFGNTLQVARIGSQGTAAPVGAGTTIAISGTGGTGLRYIGAGETTDRIISLAGTTTGGFIEQAGAGGLLKFTTNFGTPGAGAKTLTLQGSTAGAGEIAGIIGDNTANAFSTAVAKAGTGTWTLSGANTYTGATTISGGALILGNLLAVQNSVLTNSTVANTVTTGIVFKSGLGGTFSIGGLAGSQALALVDDTNAPLTSLTIGGATLTTGGTYAGILSGTTDIIKTGVSTQTFTGLNTYTGRVTVSGGLIAMNAETGLGANPGVATADQLTLNGGGISAITNTVFTIDDANRGITIGASGGTFDAQAGAVMTVSEAIAGGTNTVTKSGTGVVIFTQPNTYGTTVITGGRLRLSGAGTVGSGGVTINGGGYVVPGPGAITVGAAASGSSLIYTEPGAGTDVSSALTLAAGGTLTVDVVNSAGTVTFASAFGGGTNAGLTKAGLGALTLQGGTTGNTYTGTTTAGAGNLVLDFTSVTNPATGVVAVTSPLSFRGGTLTLLGKSGTTDLQAFASAALLEGGSTLTATQNTATSLGASLGLISRDGTTNKGTINFVLPTTGSYAVTNTNNTSGILGGWATVGGTAWAMVSGGNIASYAGEVALPATGGAATTNYSYNATTTITGNLLANAIKFTTTGLTIGLGTNNLTLSGNSGGLLQGLAAGTITGTTTNTGTGFINAGASGELMVYTNAGSTLTIGAGIGGTIVGFGLTKSGPGTLVLNNGGATANNYTGVTTINGGTVSIDAANRLGASTGVTLNGGALNSTVNFSVTQPITLGLNGGTLNMNSTAGNGAWSSTTAIAFLGSGSRTLTLGGTNTGRFGTLSAAIGDGGGPTALTINGGNDTSLFQLSAANSTYTGATTLTRGVLRLNAANALSSGSNVIFNGTGTNRAILEFNATYGTSFTAALGTLPGQVQWLGNGGFSSSNVASFAVNLGGLAAPATLTWGSGGFVPNGSALQFAQNGGNSNYGNGTVNFQNPIDLAAAIRTVEVFDNGIQVEAILSGLISGAAGSVLNKTGTGNLTLTADNTTSTDVAVTVTGGSLILPNVSAIPAATGANVTLNSGGSLVLTGSTNPLLTIGSRIVTTSAGAIALDTNSSATLDFSTFSNLSLGAYNPTIGQPVIFTGSIIPFTDNVYRLGTGRSGVNTAAVTGNNLINFTANAGNNILVLPVTNQLADAGGTRSLVVGSGATYITSYNTFSGGTKDGGLTGQAGNANLGVGHDAALGAGLIQFSANGVASTGFIGGINGDHMVSNNVSVNVASNWVSSGNLASDAIANAGAMTYAGTTALTGAVSIFSRTNSSIFLGNITGTGTITINGGTTLFLTTPAGAVNKTYAQTTAVTGGTLVIDSNNSLGSGTNPVNLATAAAATLRVQPGTGSDIILTSRNVVFTATFAPTFDIPGGPVTNTISSLILPGVVSGGATTAQVNKIGLGTLTFRGANTFSSTSANGLQIFGGTVLVDSATTATARATSSIVTALALGTSAAATAGTFGGGGTFAINAGANTTSQIFTILSSAAKDNAISLTSTTGQANLTFNGVTFNRSQQGGTLAITTSGTTNITLTGTIAANTGAAVPGAIVLDAGATGNAFATINGTDWAARNGSNQIVALGSAGAGSYTLSTATVLAGNADMDATVPTTTLAANATITSLRFNAAADEAVNLAASNLITGGILVGTGTGTNNQTISASGTGALQGVSGRDLIVINANNNGDGITTGLLTITAPIIDNTTATALTKSGPGTVVLGGNNTFTGSIFLNGGVLSVASAGTAAAANPLGQAASAVTNIIMNGGTLRYTGAGSTTTDRGATFNSYSNIEVTQAGGTLVGTGAMAGFAGGVGLLSKTGPGTLSLSGAGDNANLSALVTAGTLNLDKASTSAIHALSGGTSAAALVVRGGTVKITGSGGDQINNGSAVVVNAGGTFDLNGQGETFDALGGSGLVTNTGANGVAITLVIGDATVAGSQANNSANTPNAAAAGVAATGLNSFSGNITDNGTNKLAINKSGPGMQILSGTGNTYSGDTSVTSGVLRLGALNVLPSGAGKGNVSLTGNTVIFGLAVPGTLDMGGFDQAINGLGGTAGSIVTNTPPTSASADQTNTLQVGNNDQSSQFDGIFLDGYSIQPGAVPVGHFGFLALQKVGAGVLTLTGASTNTGSVTIDEGRIDLNNTTGNALSTNVTINTGGTLRLLASNQIADGRTVTTAGGTFDLNGRNETVGVILSSGSIIDGAGGGSLRSDSAFDLQSGTVSAKLSGTSGLSKSGAGTVTLGGGQVHNFAGPTAISAGTLVLSTGASISASTGVALTGTGRFYVNGSTAATVPVSVASGTTLGGTGTVNGTVTVDPGTGIVEAGQSGAGSLTLKDLTFSGAGKFLVYNIDGGAGASLVNVTGTLTGSGAAGSVAIDAINSGSISNGTYKLIGYNAISGTSAFTTGNISGLGGRQTPVLDFGISTPNFISLTITGDAPKWNGFTGALADSVWHVPAVGAPTNWKLITSGAFTDFQANDQVLFDDSLDLVNNPAANVVLLSEGNVSPASVTFTNTSTAYRLTGAFGIIGGTSFVKNGAGTVTIENANSFTGGVVINAGVVKLANASAIGTGNALLFGGSAVAGTKLQLFGNDATVTGLSTNALPGSPAVENGNATVNSVLTVNLATGTNTFAGVLQNGGAATLGLGKQGGGTLILTGTNAATGGNSIGAGTLQIGNGGVSGVLTGDTVIAASALLRFNRSDASAYSGGVTGAGAVSVENGGTLSITGNVAHSGGTNIAASTVLQIGNGGASGDLSGAGNITNDGTLAFNRTGSSTVQAPVIGAGNLLVGNGVTTGTLILTGNNGYSGTTTINANATLQVGNGTASGSLGTAAGITDNGTFAYGRSDAQTYATIFSGTGAIHILDGTLTLTGDNNATYSGGTNVDNGAALIVGDAAGAAGAIPGFNATGTGNLVADGGVTFRRTGTNTFDNVISGAATGNVTLAAGSWTFTNSTAYLGSTAILNGATLNIAAGTGTGIGAGAIADAGTLVFNRATPYTLTTGNIVTGSGAVTLAGGGAVIAAVNGQFNTTGVLNLGAAQGSTTAVSLDLATFDSAFGSLNVQTNTAAANTITIGAGKTLTLTGGTAAAVVIGANSGVGTTTNLNFAGSGSLSVIRAGGTFQVGGATGGTNTGNENVNMSSLTNFTTDLGATGVFRVGASASTSATTTEILTGATNNTITAGTFSVGDSTGYGGGAAAPKVFNLGGGTNAINANVINISDTNNANSARGSGLVQFAGATGTLTIRSVTGATGLTNLNLINSATTTATQHDAKLLLAGHAVDAPLNNIVMSARSGGTTQGSDATLSFDTGTLSANNLSMVARTGATLTTGASSGTVNLGGGTATFGTVTMATNSVITAVSTGAATATMNITGAGTTTITTLNMASDAVGAATSTSASNATVNIGLAGVPTVALGTVTMSVNNSASTAATTATGNINIAGGNVTAAAIAMANATNNAANVSAATLAITGGTLTLTGNITTVNGVGTENTTLTLNGGTLDMGGFSIGSATGVVGSGSGAANFQSGTLRNLLELNGGTTPLTKSGTGTLILTGTNSYTGSTAVNNGTLLVNNTGGPSGTGSGLVTVNGGTTARGTLGGTGTITGGVTLATNGATTFAQGATINPGTAGTAGTLTLSAAGLVTGNFSNLTFDLNTATTMGGGVNDLIFTDVLPVLGATTQLNINTLGTLTLGTYTLISGYTGTIANFGNLTLNAIFTGVDTTHTGSLVNSNGALQLQVIGSGFTTAYWNGNLDANWNTLTPVTFASNWRDAASGGNDLFGIPSATTDVHFNTTGAGNLATTLGQNFTIKTLTFDAAATADVSIAGSTLTITPATPATGLTMVSGAGNVTITSGIALGAAQTWTNNSTGKTLTVGAVSNGAFDATITGTGNFAQTGGWGGGAGGITFAAGFSGTATLDQANPFTGTLAVNGGTVVGTSVASALGAGALSLGGGNLKLTNPTATPLNFGRNVTVAADSTITSDVTGAGAAGNTYTLATLALSGQTLTIQGGANVNSGTAGVTFSGTTTFSTASPTFTINNPAAGGTTLLTLGAVANNPFTATIKGNGDLAQTGVWGAGSGGITLDPLYTGTVTLSQANTFTGPVTINSGTVNATVQQALGLGTGTATVAAGTTLNLTNTGTATYTGLSTVVGGGIINVTLGTGTTVATLGGDYSGFTGTTNVGVGATGGKAQINGLDNAAATMNVIANGTLFVSAAVTKNAPLFLNGGDTGESLGQLRLEGNAVWAGPVTLAGSITGTGDFTVGGNTTIGTISGNIGQTGGAKALSKGGSGTIILTGTNTYTGPTSIGAGTLQLGNGGTSGTILLNAAGIVNNGTLALNHSNNLTQSTDFGNISGTGGLLKSGTGNLFLDGTNTFTGNVTVNGGSLTGSVPFDNGAGTTTIASAAATSGYLYVPATWSYSSTSYNVGGNATGVGSLIIRGSTVTATTTNVAAGYVGGNGGYGGFFLSNGGSFTTPRFDAGASAAATAISVNQISSGTLTTTGDYILIRSGHAELTITGGAIVRTTPTNTFTIGELGIDATVNIAGGTVDNTGQTVQFGRVASSVSFASLNLNAGSLTTNAIAATAANIIGAGAARVNFNGGELKASAASATFLPAGITLATSNAAFGTYAGGAVVNTNGFNITFAKPVLAPTGNGIFGVSVGAAGTGYIGAPLVQIVGDGTGATGYAVVDLDPASGTFGQLQSVVITNPGIGYTTTPTVNLLGGGGTGAAATASAPSANASGGLVKNGAGILTLGVAGNTYTGGTVINAGNVALGVNDALADAGNVTVSGGTFDVATFTDTVATVSLQGGAITGSTGVLTSLGNYDLRSGTVNFTGAGGLAGTGNANKTTSGTVTLTNNGLGSTFANVVNVNGGTLAFSTSAQLGSAAPTNKIGINGGTLSYTGSTAVDLTATRAITIGAGHGTLNASQSTGVLTISGGVTGTGNLTKTGTGTVIIPGTTNLAGASLTVSDGTLRAGFGTNGVGTITIGATGNLDLNNATIEALVLNNSAGALTLIGGAKLGFELTNALTNDSIALGATGTAVTGGIVTLNFSGTVANGTYNLLSSTVGGLNGSTYVLGTAPSGFNYTINKTDFLVSLAAAPFVPRYWTGSEATTSWATVNGAGPFTTNFSTDAAGTLNAGSVPGAAHTVIFSATAVAGAPTSITTTLDGSYTIDGLQFIAAPAGVTDVTINRGTAGSTLTLAPISTSGGILVDANAGNETINAPLVASTTQTWNIDGTGVNGSSLTIGGATASVAFSAAVTKTGGGALTLASANTGAGAFILSAGTLNINNNTALGSGTFTIGAGTTIDNTSAGLVTLTNNNLQNWNGGFVFTGTQDLDLGTGAVTLGASGGVLTSTAGKVLTVGGVIDDGSSTFSLTKAGAGTLVLNGNNGYDGLTDLQQGTLTLAGNNSGASGGVSMAATTTLNLGDAAALGTGTFTINGGTIDNTAGAPLTLSTNNAQNWNGSFTFTGGNNLNLGSGAVTLGATPTVAVTANTLTAGPLGDGGSVFGITKDGAGTLELGGVSSYKGATVINRGTLRFLTGTQNFGNISNTLTFGTAAGSTNVGTLDLGTASATFGGTATVQTNSATANTITIGAGQTLRLNGAVNVGYNSTGNSTTRLNVTGSAGTLTIGTAVQPTNTNLSIGNGTTTNVSNAAMLDLSGVGTFLANLGIGTLRVGSTTNAGGTAAAGSTLILAPVSTIIATTISSDSPDSAVTQAIKLGSTTNVINATTITIGGAANRSNGTLDFNGATGTVQIRGLTGGLTRAALNVQNGATGTGANPVATVNFNGHDSDLLLGAVAVGGRSAGTTGSGTGTFSFDTGTLDATSFNLAARTGTTVTTGNVTGTLNLGGGTVNITTVTMSTNSVALTAGSSTGNAVSNLNISGSGINTIGTVTMGVNTVAAGFATGSDTNATITITGGTTTVNTAFTMGAETSALNAATTVNTATSALNISAGSLTLAGTVNLRMGQATLDAENAATATINITGTGTLTVGGNILYTNAALGTETNVINLDGGTLDLTSGNIGGVGTVGTADAGTIIFNAQSGTLQNLAQLNGGATLSKTTAGTLILTGTNAYTGLTDVTAGIVRVQSATGLGAVAGATSVTSGANLQLEGVNVGAENLTLNGTGTASQGALSATGTAQNSGTVTLATASSVGTPTLADNLTLTGVVQGTVALTKVGAGTLNLSGLNTYSGATNIEAGTVNANTVAPAAAPQSLGAGNTVNLGVTTASSGTLNYTGNVATLDKNINALGNGTDTVRNSGTGLLTLSGTVNKNGTTLTLDSGVNGIRVTGQITGAAANSDLTVTGGTTTLANNNPYNGATAVTPTGTLAVTGSLSGTTVVNNSGTLRLNSSTDANNIVQGTGGGVVSGTGPNFTGGVAYSGTNGSTLAAGNTIAGGVTNTFLMLTLSGTSTLDFGLGNNGNTFLFGAAGSLPDDLIGGTILNITNWQGSSYVSQAGSSAAADNGTWNDGQSRLLFNANPGFTIGAQINGINFIGFGAGMAVSFGGQFEIVPVPEPATAALLGTVALCALLGYRGRRRAYCIRSQRVRS